PAAGTPPPGRAGAVKIGNILFVGGHTPGPAYRGKLGAGFTVEQGYDGARQACLNCLADVKAVIGDLDKVKRVAKLLCMVNSAPDFGQQPLVANGATDLLSQLYGDAGAHARSAVGLAALPNGACIEIEMILEVEDWSCTPTLRPIPLAQKPGKIPPSHHTLEGATPWCRIIFSTNSPYVFSCGSSSCCMSRGP